MIVPALLLGAAMLTAFWLMVVHIETAPALLQGALAALFVACFGAFLIALVLRMR